ncbi:hypothetical protein J6E39_03265 [bacterium]|nr:hypothetical protein [bacterium]
MQVDRTTQKYNNNVQFGAIFKVKKLADSTSDVIIDLVKRNTIEDEVKKINNKFLIGGGELFVYVPDKNLQKLLDNLNSRIANQYHANYLTRVD